MWVPPASLDDGYDVRGPKGTRVGKENVCAAVPVVHRPAEGIRICRPQTSLAGLHSLKVPPQTKNK